MKRFVFCVYLLLIVTAASFSQVRLSSEIYRMMEGDFACRDFYSRNPMWIESSVFIKDLNTVKGKILHTRTETYNMDSDGLKFYEYSEGYPIDDRYIVFDRDGTIVYECRVLYQSAKPDEKHFEYDRYVYSDGKYQIVTDSPGGERPFVQEFKVEKGDDGSVVFIRRHPRTGVESVVYRFFTEGGKAVFENRRYFMNEKKIVLDNQYVDSKIIYTSERQDVELNPIGFYSHLFTHPAEIGSPGYYREEKTEILDAPDDILREYFARLF